MTEDRVETNGLTRRMEVIALAHMLMRLVTYSIWFEILVTESGMYNIDLPV